MPIPMALLFWQVREQLEAAKARDAEQGVLEAAEAMQAAQGRLVHLKAVEKRLLRAREQCEEPAGLRVTERIRPSETYPPCVSTPGSIGRHALHARFLFAWQGDAYASGAAE